MLDLASSVWTGLPGIESCAGDDWEFRFAVLDFTTARASRS